MPYSGYWLGTVYVVTLKRDDFLKDDIAVSLLRLLHSQQATNVVVDISDIDIVHSRDIKTLNALSALCVLHGMRTKFVGMKPDNAAIVVHFVEEFEFDTSLSVERAARALQH